MVREAGYRFTARRYPMRQMVVSNIVKLMRRCSLDCMLFSTILLVGRVYTFGIETVLDIGLYDESSYLHSGLLIPTSGFPAAQNAPLYALWYYVLSFHRSDPVKLYFLNYKLMTVLPPLVLFVVLRAYRVPRISSLALSFVLLFSASNFPTWPKVSHFAVLVLLSGFFLIALVREQKLQTATIAITTLFASYVRPEYFLAFTCLAVLLFILTFLDLKRIYFPKAVAPLLVTSLFCISLILWLGVPVGGGRSMMAFGQHYAGHWVRWNKDSRNPWTNWRAIVKNDFGDVHSPIQAFFANPLAVVHHVSQNMRDLPSQLKEMFLASYPFSRPVHTALKLAILLLAFTALVYVRRSIWAEFRQRIRSNFVSGWFVVALLFVVMLPVAISIVVIAPRRHYLYILGVLSLLGIAILFFRRPADAGRVDSSYVTVALLCLSILMMVRPLSNSLPLHRQPNLKTIKYLRKLNLTMPVNMLEAEGGYNIYVGDNYTRVPEYAKDSPFVEFLSKRAINMIVLSPRLAKDVRFRDDPQWHSFLNAPESFGFVQMPIPGVEGRILFVKKEILISTQSQGGK